MSHRHKEKKTGGRRETGTGSGQRTKLQTASLSDGHEKSVKRERCRAETPASSPNQAAGDAMDRQIGAHSQSAPSLRITGSDLSRAIPGRERQQTGPPS